VAQLLRKAQAVVVVVVQQLVEALLSAAVQVQAEEQRPRTEQQTQAAEAADITQAAVDRAVAAES
jgi:hypothetical protein